MKCGKKSDFTNKIQVVQHFNELVVFQSDVTYECDKTMHCELFPKLRFNLYDFLVKHQTSDYKITPPNKHIVFTCDKDDVGDMLDELFDYILVILQENIDCKDDTQILFSNYMFSVFRVMRFFDGGLMMGDNRDTFDGFMVYRNTSTIRSTNDILISNKYTNITIDCSSIKDKIILR
jgi:hypothetical protein